MNKNKNMNRGAAILSLIFVLLFFTITARFMYIQTTGKAAGEVLAAKAAEKYERKRVIEGTRGSILDRNGEIIAQDTSSYRIFAVLDEELTQNPKRPQHVTDPAETAEKLAPLLDMEEREVFEILSRDKKQVEFGSKGRSLTQAQKNEIEDLELPGIAFSRDSIRYYPNGMFASHIIGYAEKNQESGEIIGQMGLEKNLDNYLKSKDGYMTYEGDHYGWKLPNGDETVVPPQNGKTVYLTIDQKIQAFLEDGLNSAMEEYQPQKIIAVVADPKTGEILGMGQRPSFNPNTRDISNYYNDSITYRFEPGSTMKIFTLAAAIEEGVYNGDETFSSGSFPVGGRVIRDHNKTGWGEITYNEGVQRSSNVAFANLVSQKIGYDRFFQYLHKFQLDQKTGIDLPGETDSSINYKREQDKVSSAFGQASAYTPIQLVQAATAIANGGNMMQPYIIDKIVDEEKNEVVQDNKPKVKSKPISEKTSKEVLDILETVVSSEKGTGKPYQIEGYEVAGKTGTAQIWQDGGYLRGHDNFLFSFIGMAPKDDPQLLVYVAVQQPNLKETEIGAMPVSTVFNTVMRNSLQYLEIKPQAKDKNEQDHKKEKQEAGKSLANLTGENISSVKKKLGEMKAEPVVLGNGSRVESQFPLEDARLTPGEKVFISTGGTIKMPDITGWSKRDILKLAKLMELDISFEGSGYGASQNIPAGKELRKADKLVVGLNNPEDLNEAARQASQTAESDEDGT
ncbi:PASTA domain-containing protein [Bacillus lacus]|uniref:serine-type D-Ala-D-Ala carboxypeptidase n=1 Tax=Metabacillus lacus TaxID=1983721 RepID=A0A7X2IW39_9BACI|nr:penicillin-binding protein [Metabacillus lacus]MRX70815.1 PASTA domain-containing protein [Metabacillus lacus]